VYRSQTRIVEHLTAIGDGDLGVVTDAAQLAAHLRARDAVIVCGPDTVTIDEPAADQTPRDARLAEEVHSQETEDPHRDPHQT